MDFITFVSCVSLVHKSMILCYFWFLFCSWHAITRYGRVSLGVHTLRASFFFHVWIMFLILLLVLLTWISLLVIVVCHLFTTACFCIFDWWYFLFMWWYDYKTWKFLNITKLTITSFISLCLMPGDSKCCCCIHNTQNESVLFFPWPLWWSKTFRDDEFDKHSDSAWFVSWSFNIHF